MAAQTQRRIRYRAALGIVALAVSVGVARPCAAQPVAPQPGDPAATAAAVTQAADLLRTGQAAHARGQYRLAVLYFRAALVVAPDDFAAQNNLAWLLATAPDESVRRPAEALAIARRAAAADTTGRPETWDTLGAAHAAAGDFSQALAAADRARRAARRQDRREVLDEIEAHRRGYAQGRAVIERPPTSAADQPPALLRRAAILDFVQAMQKTQPGALLLAELAWRLATHPDAGLRDASAAVMLAEAARQSAWGGQPEVLDALAAGCAAMHDFATAQRWTLHALDRSRVAGGRHTPAARRQWLQQYRAQRPLRDAALPPRDRLLGERDDPLAASAYLLAREQESPATAVALLNLATQIDPWCAAAWSALHDRLSDDKHHAAAAHCALMAVALRDDAQAWHRLGLAWWQAGNHAQAIAAYRQACKREPDSVTAANNLAWLLVTHPDPAKRDAAEAIRLLQPFTSSGGPAADAVADTLAAAHAQQGDFAAAADILRRAAHRAGQPNQLTEAALFRVQALRYQAGLKWEDRRWDTAFLRRVAGTDDVAAHLLLAEAALLDEHWDQAAAHCRAALRIRGRLPAAWHYLGLAHRQQDDPIAAIACLARAVRLEGQFGEAADDLAWLLAVSPENPLHDPELARWLNAQVRASRAGLWKAHDTHAVILAMLGQFEQAAEAAAHAAASARRDGLPGTAEAIHRRRRAYQQQLPFTQPFHSAAPSADLAAAHAELGLLCLSQSQHALAQRHFDAALRLDAGMARVWHHLGTLHAQQGREAQAVACYRQALKVQPDLLETANNLAHLLATGAATDRRDAQQAIELAESVCRATKRRLLPALDTLALAQSAAGDIDAAAATIREAMALAEAQGNTDMADAFRRRLNALESGRVSPSP